MSSHRPTHSFSVVIGAHRRSPGFIVNGGRGSLVSGSSVEYTANGESRSVTDVRSVGTDMLAFGLSGTLVAADFPSRIVCTKTTGGVVERSFTPDGAGVVARARGTVQFYDAASGTAADVIVAGQTVRVDLYYAAVERAVSGAVTRGTPTATGTVTRETVAPKLVSGVATRGAPTAHAIIRSEDTSSRANRSVVGAASRGVPTAAGIVRRLVAGEQIVVGRAARGEPEAAGRMIALDPITVPPGAIQLRVAGGTYRQRASAGVYSVAATPGTYSTEASRCRH